MNQGNLATVLWGVADLLRGTLKQSQYGRVILPFTVECVLEPTRDKVLNVASQAEGIRHWMLKNTVGLESTVRHHPPAVINRAS